MISPEHSISRSNERCPGCDYLRRLHTPEELEAHQAIMVEAEARCLPPKGTTANRETSKGVG